MLTAFGQEHREILGNLIHVRSIGRSRRSFKTWAIRQLEKLQRQHMIAGSLPSRRAQPPRISVLEPGRRRAGRRVSPLVALGIALVAVVVAVLLLS
jgi:hypothetical protein